MMTLLRLLVRRHHCKRCGRVVCSSCGANRLVLPSRPDRSLRVCLACYTVLLEIKSECRHYTMNSEHDIIQRIETYRDKRTRNNSQWKCPRLHQKTAKRMLEKRRKLSARTLAASTPSTINWQRPAYGGTASRRILSLTFVTLLMTSLLAKVGRVSTPTLNIKNCFLFRNFI